MRRRILVCDSKPCEELEPLARCRWRCKTLTCQVMDLVSISELKTHASPLHAPRKPRLTEEMKDVARALARQGLKPVLIRNAFLTRFNLDETSLPALPTVQRFTQHYTRKNLGRTDDHDDVRDQVSDLAYKADQPDTEAFTFTCEYGADEAPHVGKGPDDDPFIVGLTSARLLKRAAGWDPSTFVVHADATFKLNQVGYPVFVVGVSDLARSFHLLALFVTSQRRESDYVKMLTALNSVYYRVNRLQFAIRCTMADADDAQWGATQAVFAGEGHMTGLMCYYHVMAKVYGRTRSLGGALAALVTEGVADMHFARSASEFQLIQERVLAGWAVRPSLRVFRAYFIRQWLTGRFVKWQAFHTPRGFATTNNPVEQFNRTLKRVYTLHTRLKMGTLVTQLCLGCRSESISAKPFVVLPTVPSSLWRRMRELRRAKLLFEWTLPRSSFAFVLTEDIDAAPSLLANVISKPCRRVLDEETSRKREVLLVTAQMSWSGARMEHYGMPETGWAVDLERRECPCLYFAKFCTCVHPLLAISKRGIADVSALTRLVYRGSNRARRLLEGASNDRPAGPPAGRPPLNTFALNPL